MRSTISAVLLAGSTFFTGFSVCGGIAEAANAATERVTFGRDVLPILAKHCQGCHRPGEIAPNSFLTYESTRPWASKIKALVTNRKMPPLIGTPHYTVLTQGEGLTQSEIAILVKWVNEGAPKGGPRDARPLTPAQGQKN
jgi:hypothetical protein